MNTQPASNHSVSPVLLWFGILAAPLGWSAHELVSYMAASYLCRLRAAVMSESHVYALSAPFVLITIGTLGLALAGAWVSYRNWRKVRGKPRGSQMELNEIDPERQHFLARCGLINSAIFIVAFFFTTADILVKPLCGK